ncbi:phospholipase D StSicTox-betaIC1-like [Galendromus occidentalis]|uniref:Phospholipase D StSicTox-betaIC1-like n=1 Tax=Galendromus occidentalis TaxID=34638 RepID=A0AAJ7SE63_9ACAR|nr:phospholipase D StSicTox-betaIC1-like [Galendromus occidentalis]
MVNSIPEIDYYLNRGANAIEADVNFSPDGSALSTYHGVPCDCFRRCMLRSSFSDYLKYVREVTVHKGRNIALLMLDLKLEESKVPKASQRYAGIDLFTKLVDHLWYQVNQTHRVNVLVSIPRAQDRMFLKGFLSELNKEENQKYAKNIGYDVGMNSYLAEISSMYESLGIRKNIWQGDGITNCLVGMRPENRLREVIDLRDAPSGYVRKVYYWTIDLTSAMENILQSGVDAIITNHPERLNSLINYSYSARYRLANRTDSPWEKIISVSKSGSLAGSRRVFLDIVVNILELGAQARDYFSRLLSRSSK